MYTCRGHIQAYVRLRAPQTTVTSYNYQKKLHVKQVIFVTVLFGLLTNRKVKHDKFDVKINKKIYKIDQVLHPVNSYEIAHV